MQENTDVKITETTPEDQLRAKRRSTRRLCRVKPSWIKKASLTILSRKINQLLDLGKEGKIEKDDVEVLLKCIEAARKLEKDSGGQPEEIEVEIPQ
jgi:hypothetical protein